MIVLRIAIVELVDRPAIQLKTLQQSGIDEFTQRPVNRRGADIVLFAATGQSVNQLVGIKMVMLLKDSVDQEFSLTRLPQTASLQVLFEPLLR